MTISIKLYKSDDPTLFTFASVGAGGEIANLTAESGTGIVITDNTQFSDFMPIMFEPQENAVACSFFRGSACVLKGTNPCSGGSIVDCHVNHRSSFFKNSFGFSVDDGTPNYYKWGIFFIMNNGTENVYDLKVGFSDTNNDSTSGSGINMKVMVESMEAQADIRRGENLLKYKKLISSSDADIADIAVRSKMSRFEPNATLAIAVFTFPQHNASNEWPDSYAQPSSEDQTWGVGDYEYGYFDDTPKNYRAKLYVSYKA